MVFQNMFFLGGVAKNGYDFYVSSLYFHIPIYKIANDDFHWITAPLEVKIKLFRMAVQVVKGA